MTIGIIGTTQGVFKLENGNLKFLGLDQERISAVHIARAEDGSRRLLAGSYESGLFRSDDEGQSWSEVGSGFSALCVRWLGDDPLNPGSLLAGTEPGRIFRGDAAGAEWKELSGIRKIPEHKDWFLPYSPRAGAVRNVFNPPGSRRYLASVEVGGLLTSDDNGQSWTCSNVEADSDVHFITGHPEDGAILFAALGYAGMEGTPNPPAGDEKHRGGLSRSTDGGRSWQKLFGDYTRAVIVPASKPEIVIAGPSPDVGKNGRIEVSLDGGDSWQDASEGIDTPMPDMVEVFEAAPDGSVWAICSGGRLLAAHPDELVWRPVIRDQGEVNIESVAFSD